MRSNTFRRAGSPGWWLAGLLVLSLIAPHDAHAAFGDPFVEADFNSDNALDFWTISAGSWQLSNQTLVDAASGAADIATATDYDPFDLPTLNADFALDAYASVRSATAGARAGLVFNFSDPGNYYEVTFTANGNAQLRSIIGGVATTLASGTIPSPGTNRFVHIKVVRSADHTAVSFNGVRTFDNILQQGVPEAGDVGVVSRGARAQFDDFRAYDFGLLIDPYLEDFNNRVANRWTPQSGAWSAASGAYANRAVEATNITLSPLGLLFGFGEKPFPQVYTVQVRMLNPYSGSGNLVGVVVGHHDANNYSEITFSPQGVMQLRNIVGGMRTTVGTASYGGGGPHQWFDVEVAFQGSQGGQPVSWVKVNGVTVAQNLPLNFENGFGIGLVTHWAPGRFDDMRAAPRIFTGWSANFDDGRFPREFFSAITTWRVQDGALNSYGVGKNDWGAFDVWHDLTNTVYRAGITNHYGSSGNRAGLIYAWRAADDYYEVVFNPTGTAFLNRVLKGQTINIATAPYTGGGPHQRFEVSLIYQNSHTTVKVGSQTIFSNVFQPDAATGRLGVVTHYTNASFDDVQIAALTPP